jgi:hypothetical protein
MYRVEIYENERFVEAITLIDGDSAVIEAPGSIRWGRYFSLKWRIGRLERRNRQLEEMLETSLSKVSMEAFTDEELTEELRFRMSRERPYIAS